MAIYEMTVKIEIPEDFGEFQSLELKILEASRKAGQEVLQKVFVDYQEMQISKRSVQKHDQQEKKFKTLFGVVPFKRWRVFDVFKKKDIYLVDEWMGLKAHQSVSPGLSGELVEQCVQRPYSQATTVCEKISGVKRSVKGNWKLVQKIGKSRRENKSEIADWKKKSLPELMPGAEDPCPILGMDPDATYVKPRRKTEKNHEMKMAVIYTGRKEVGQKNKNEKQKNRIEDENKNKKNQRWELVQKQVVMTIINEKADQLFNAVTEKAVNEYGLHSQSRVVVHGDGDPWIKQFGDYYCPQALNRLDPWHVFKKIREATDIKKIPEDWYDDFYKSPTALIQKVEALGKEMAEKKDSERIGQLVGYLKNNKEGMKPSGVPKEIKEKFPRMYRRGSGTIESNIFQNICQRFKGTRMMWSESGLKNLSFLREEYQNRIFDFKKVNVRKENYRSKTRMDELREVARDL